MATPKKPTPKPKAPATKPTTKPAVKPAKEKPLYDKPLKPNKNWRKAPSDADVTLKGYNDPATLKKMAAKKKGM